MTLSEKDRKAACALLAGERRKERKRHSRQYRKSITTKLSMEERRQLSIRTQIDYDPKTDHVTIASGLKYCHCTIYPGTKRHRSCYDQTGIDYLMKNRERMRAYHRAHRQKKKR